VSTLGQHKFTRQQRLTKPSQFKAVFDSSTRLSNNIFVVLLRPSNETTTPRLGLAIPKRYVQRAVDRNLIRRKIRESFRIKCRSLPNVDIVVLVRKKPSDMSRQFLRNEIITLWKRVEKRCNV